MLFASHSCASECFCAKTESFHPGIWEEVSFYASAASTAFRHKIPKRGDASGMPLLKGARKHESRQEINKKTTQYLIMRKVKYVLNGLFALTMVLLFAQCTDKKGSASSEETTAPAAAGGTSNMKIAYVEIDSLLTKYHFWNDLNEAMIQKEENIRTTLNEKAKELDQEMREFQRKLENNGFASRERAEQENLRLSQKQRDLQQLQQKLAADLQTENQKNSLQLRDSINSFLKIYNKDKGYSLIISNSGFDNLLYADPAFNITQEIVEGLNARYNAKTNKK